MYARILTSTVLNVDSVVAHLKSTGQWQRVLSIFDAVVEQQVTRTISMPLLPAYQKSQIVIGICEEVKAELSVYSHILSSKIMQFVEETIQLESLIRSKLVALSPSEFEGILHPVFQQDEMLLILIGAALGATVGLLQVYLFNL